MRTKQVSGTFRPATYHLYPNVSRSQNWRRFQLSLLPALWTGNCSPRCPATQCARLSATRRLQTGARPGNAGSHSDQLAPRAVCDYIIGAMLYDICASFVIVPVEKMYLFYVGHIHLRMPHQIFVNPCGIGSGCTDDQEIRLHRYLQFRPIPLDRREIRRGTEPFNRKLAASALSPVFSASEVNSVL